MTGSLIGCLTESVATNSVSLSEEADDCVEVPNYGFCPASFIALLVASTQNPIPVSLNLNVVAHHHQVTNKNKFEFTECS